MFWKEEKVPELEFGCIYTGKIIEILDRWAVTALKSMIESASVRYCTSTYRTFPDPQSRYELKKESFSVIQKLLM